MHKLPELFYDYSALEPFIDARTMELHHTKHHQTYVDNLNKALDAAGGSWGDLALADLVARAAEVPEAQRNIVRNHGGGHLNHSLFWTSLQTKSDEGPGKLAHDLIARDFGSFDTFKEKFSASALGLFGSGWTYLQIAGGKLAIKNFANQDSPVYDGSGTPILGLDVWEHAYYLKYQNRRKDYVEAWWNVINWAEIEARLTKATAG